MTGDKSERLDATIHGYVQGVGFRWFVARVAARLNLVGWVANESDGSVRVVVEGERSALDAMLTNLRDGPPSAEVETITEQWGAASGEYRGFEIRARAHRGD